MANESGEVGELIARARIKSGMIQMGEKIAWGSDSGVIDELCDALSSSNAALADALRLLRDGGGHYEPTGGDWFARRDAFLAKHGPSP